MGRKRGVLFAILCVLFLGIAVGQGLQQSVFVDVTTSVQANSLQISGKLFHPSLQLPLTNEPVSLAFEDQEFLSMTDESGTFSFSLTFLGDITQLSLTHTNPQYAQVPLLFSAERAKADADIEQGVTPPDDDSINPSNDSSNATNTNADSSIDANPSFGRASESEQRPNTVITTQDSGSEVPSAFSIEERRQAAQQRTAASDESCAGGVCRRTLYSGELNVFKDGDFVPVETDLKEVRGFFGDTHYENKQNLFETVLEDSTEGEMLTTTLGSNEVGFTLLGANLVSASPEDNQIAYEDVYENVDIHYEIFPGMVKETIVLLDGNSPRIFSYQLRLRNVEPRLHGDGSIGFYERRTDRMIWVLPRPFMTDDAYENELSTPASLSYDVHYELHKDRSDWFIDVVVGDSWLAEPSRAYPVYVDPTIQLQTADTQNLGDTFAYSNASAIDNASASVSLFAGSSFNSPIGSYLKFNISSFLNLNRTILTARLILYHLGDSANASGQNYSVFNITNQSWIESDCFTTDTCPAIGSLVNTTTPDGVAHTNYSQRFDVTAFVRWAIETGSLHNISFFLNRTYNASLSPDFDRFASKEFPDVSRRPILEIEFFEQCSPTDNWVVGTEVFCNGMTINTSTLTINSTGLLILQNSTLAVTGDLNTTIINGSLRLVQGSTIVTNGHVDLRGNLSISQSQFRNNNSGPGKNYFVAHANSIMTMENSSNFTNGPENLQNGFSATFLQGSRVTLRNSAVQQVAVNSPQFASKGFYVASANLLVQNMIFSSNVTGSALLVLGNGSLGASITSSNFSVNGDYAYGLVAMNSTNLQLQDTIFSQMGNSSTGLLIGTEESQFTNVSAVFTHARAGASAFAANSTVYVLGGASDSSLLGDFLRFDGTTWTNLSGAPHARRDAYAAHHQDLNITVLFSGAGALSLLNETWTYNHSNFSWTNLTSALEAPLPRMGHTLVYDTTARNRMILFGGSTTASGSSPSQETWVLNFTDNPAKWHRKTAGVPPSARLLHASAFDEVTGKMVIFGGKDANGDTLLDTWTYNPSLGPEGTWSNVTPVYSPPMREGASMYFDKSLRTLVLVGGKRGTVHFPDMWTFDTQTLSWRNVSNFTQGFVPPERAYMSAVFEPLSRTVYLIGGNHTSGVFHNSSLKLGENTTSTPFFNATFSNLTINATGGNISALILRNAINFTLSHMRMHLTGADSQALTITNSSHNILLNNFSVNVTGTGAYFGNNTNLTWLGGSIDVQSSGKRNILFNETIYANLTSVQLLSPSSNVQTRVEGGNVFFVNTSVVRGQSQVSSGSLNVFWYLDVFVRSREGINNSNVSILNNTADSNLLVAFTKTNNAGYIPTQTLFGYIQTASALTVMENYTLQANFSYINSSRNIVLNSSRLEEFVLNFPCSPPSSGVWVPLPYELCSNVTFQINGSIDIRPLTSLEFFNVTMTISNGSTNGQFTINNSNTFVVNRSTLRGLITDGTRNYLWHNFQNSVIDVYNSVISEVGINDPTSPYLGRGIYIRSAYANFVNNTITVGNANNNNRGIYLIETSGANVTDNFITISSNTNDVLSGGASAIYIGNSSFYNRIERNRIISSGSGTHGIVIEESIYNNLTSNEFNSSATGASVVFFEIGGHHVVANNTVRSTGFNTDGMLISSSSSNNRFENNTITTSARFNDGLHILSNSKNNIVKKNNITTTFDDSHALFVETSSNLITIEENLLNTTGAGGVGLYINGVSNSTVSANRIVTSGSASAIPFGAHGVYITASSNGLFTNNNISTAGTSSYSLYLYYTDNIQFVSNLFNSTNADAIVIQGNAPIMYNHTFINSSVNNRTILYIVNEQHAIYENISYAGQIFVVNSNNVTLRNITIIDAYNLNLLFTDNSSLYNMTITNASGRAIVADYAKNNTVYDSALNGKDNDVYVREQSDLFLVNTTYAENDVAFNSDTTPSYPPGYLKKGWRVDIRIVDTENNSGLSGVEIQSRDKDTVVQFLLSTNSSGNLATQQLSEFQQNHSGKLFKNNHTFNWSKNQYFSNGTSVNISNNTVLVLGLSLAISNIQLNVSISPLVVYAQNFTFNGSFYDADFQRLQYEIYKDTYNFTTVYAWVQRNGTTPGNRSQVAMAYYPEARATILFGGYLSTGSDTYYNDTWAYNATTDAWTQVAAANAPPARAASTLVYDEKYDVLVLFGGRNSTHKLNDTWYYNSSNSSWTQITAVTPPTNRSEYVMIYDVFLNATVLFGGHSTGALNDTWIFNFTNSTWRNLTPSVDTPLPLSRLSSFAYDKGRRVAYLFGGYDGVVLNAVNVTYMYNSSENSWTLLNPSASPTSRFGATLSYDAYHDQMLLFGGSLASGITTNETWMLNLTSQSWLQHEPSSALLARYQHGGTVDETTSTLVVYGGQSGTRFFNETWNYNHSILVQLQNRTLWTNGLLSTRTFLTNSSLNITLTTLNDTRSVNLTLVEGTVNASYLTAGPTINVSEMVAAGIFSADFVEVNGSVNLSLIPGFVLNVSSLSSSGKINSSFVILTDITNTTFQKSYDGIYLPEGSWTLEVAAVDRASRNLSSLINFTSEEAIEHIAVSGNSTAYINTTNATFLFKVRTKTHPYAKFYLNLSLFNSSFQFNSNFAKIGNSTLKRDVGNDTYYTNAQTWNVTPSTSATIPSDVFYYNGLYDEFVTLYLEPYEGLSAGTYVGTYGWGLSDGP